MFVPISFNIYLIHLVFYSFIYLFIIFFLQKVLFRQFSDLQDFAIANVASIDTRTALKKHFSLLE